MRQHITEGQVFHLSLSQKNIWNLERAFTGVSINNISCTIGIRGHIDFGLLQKSLEIILEKDSCLRTRITLVDEEPRQYHAPFEKEYFPVYDFSMSDPEAVIHWERVITHESIFILDNPLYQFYLYKTGENSGGVLVKTHHIISDGWTQMMLCNRIANLYLELLNRKNITLEESPDYELHIHKEQVYLESAMMEKDQAYWRKCFEIKPEAVTLHSVKGAVSSPVGRRKSYELSETLNRAIYKYCMEQRVSPFSVFYMALAIYLKRVQNVSRFTVGVPIFNRNDFVERQTTGMFVSTLPFVNEIDDRLTLSELNEQVTERWYELLRHQRLPYPYIEEIAAEVTKENGRLFHIALSYQDSKMMVNHDPSVSFSGSWHYSGYQSEHLCIHLTNREDHTRYAVDYDYLLQLFTEKEIDHLHHYLVEILSEALENPGKPLCQLSVLDFQEKEKVLYLFNQTAQYYPQISPYEKFMEMVRLHPKKVAVIYAGERYTYEQLNYYGCSFACSIQKFLRGNSRPGDTNQMRPDSRVVAIMLPRGVRMMEALVGIMAANATWVLLPLDLPDKRIETMLLQSDTTILITERHIIEKRQIDTGNVVVLYAENVDFESEYVNDSKEKWNFSDCAESDEDVSAYIVFTSGSTGTPKGVEISRKSLVNFAYANRTLFGNKAVLSLCSVGFDVFVMESAAALLNGRTIVLAEEEDLEQPARLAELINSYAVGFFAITPSRLNAYLKDPNFAWALQNMESIICGGEAFQGEFLQQLQMFTEARIYNQYGPSEATVGVSYKLMNQCSSITVGKPMDNCRMYVLDERLNPLPVGIFGNLYLGGVCLAKGYYGCPELTKEKFVKNPFELNDLIYDTGDIAAWTVDGEIKLAGRRDGQIKLHGQRMELQEIIDSILSYPPVKEATVRAVNMAGEDYLVAYYVAEELVREGELLAFLSARLPRYMLPARFLSMTELPLSANGKIEECKLPLPEIAADNSIPENLLQEDILSVFCQVLKITKMGIDSDYFQSGGTSLNAMETIAALQEKFGMPLRISDLYAYSTIRRMSAYLTEQLVLPGEFYDSGKELIKKAPLQRTYPVTPAQQSLYVQSCMDESGFAYHMPGIFTLSKAPDISKLSRAFQSLICQDDIFRTGFIINEKGLCQVVHDQVEFELKIMTQTTLEEASEAFLQPFDLKNPPLLRAALWKSETGNWMLLIDLHHIIGDGISTPIMWKRIDALYRGEGTDAPKLTYKDYAYWLENREMEEKQKAYPYWEKHLEIMPKPLDLPTDMGRTGNFDFKGQHMNFRFTEELSRSCTDYCDRNELSANMLFAAAFGILLGRISGLEDLLVGTPVSGRTQTSMWDICGPFINTLPLRLSPGKTLLIEDYLKTVKQNVLSVLEYQNIGLEDLINMKNLPRTLGQNPLFQVLFSFRPLNTKDLLFDGETVDYRPVSTGTAKMELNLEAAMSGECYALDFEFAESLFDKETIAFYGDCLEYILTEIISGSKQKIGELSVMSPKQQWKLIEEPQQLFTPYVNLPIDILISRNSEVLQDKPAIICHGEVMTYRQLEHRARCLAGKLQSAGVRPKEKIGIAGSRNADFIAGMLAILKTGCAYVPLLADFPEERLNYMLETAGVSRVLCDKATFERLPEGLVCSTVIMDRESENQNVDKESRELTDHGYAEVTGRSTQDLIHVLFTSGSTGRPKGVMVPHRGISNLAASVRPMMEASTGCVLCSTNVIFDTFITETLLPLRHGKTIVMADEEEMMLPWKLAELINQYQITLMQMTPSRLQVCLGNAEFAGSVRKLEKIILAGEALTKRLVSEFQSVSQASIINMYGPTEASVYVTAGEMKSTEAVTIGKPLPNCRIYILDEDGNPVLPTARGELYLAGECLADGYVNRDDLTEQLFLPEHNFPGQKMYRSGDIGRMRMDGTIDYLGRKDSQIKLNGQRVETQEIDSAMLDSGLVEQAAVLVITREDGSKALKAFVVPKGGSFKMSDLRKAMGRRLPDYMIPSEIIELSKMPFTPSGKIDMAMLKGNLGQARLQKTAEYHTPDPVKVPVMEIPEVEVSKVEIPEVEISEEELQKEELQKEELQKEVLQKEELQKEELQKEVLQEETTEELLNTMWCRILEKTEIDKTSSFFEQGGTSLAAMRVLSEYYDRGLMMTMAQFYEEPTFRGQLELLGVDFTQKKDQPVISEHSEIQDHPEVAEVIETPDYQQFIQETELSHYQEFTKPVEASSYYGDAGHIRTSAGVQIFLTGATGFLGAHLLKELLQDPENHVICLVRESGILKMAKVLQYYFGEEWTNWAMDHMELVIGDICMENLGMSQEKYAELIKRIDVIYHTAADVRHYAIDESLKQTNLFGTIRVIDFAKKSEAVLNHVSTISVSGDYLVTCPKARVVFEETDLEIGQNWQDNAYVSSKYLAEHQVLNAFSEGLRGKIFRVGCLVGRASDGTFQMNPSSNAFYQMIQGLSVTRGIPESLADMPVDLMPVDICAKAILDLNDSSIQVAHMIAPEPYSMREIGMELFHDFTVYEDRVMEELVQSKMKAGCSQMLMPLMELWIRYRQYPINITPDCRLTQSELEVLGKIMEIPGPSRVLQNFVRGEK